MQTVIDEFLNTLYGDEKNKRKNELECYEEMKVTAQKKLIEELEKGGCKAIVTSRIKQKDSLKRKLYKRDASQNNEKYKTCDDIRNDIFDFLGIRISLYFPNDMYIVDEIIEKNFKIEKKIIHPQKRKQHKQFQKNDYTKKFSGYEAQHYRVSLSDDIMERIVKREEKKDVIKLNPVFEIQVISLVLHAWAEVEHDIVYKSDYNDLSRETHFILDEINGLMELGEFAFIRLKNEIAKNVSEHGIFSDHYELSVYIRDNIPKDILGSHKVGNMKYLFNILKYVDGNKKNKIDQMISEIDFGSMNYLSGEFIKYLMIESADYYYQSSVEKSNIVKRQKESQETFEERIKMYKELIKEYAVFLHIIYIKGESRRIFDDLKSPENAGEELLDLLISQILDIEISEISFFRKELHDFGTVEKCQTDKNMERLVSQLREYQNILMQI